MTKDVKKIVEDKIRYSLIISTLESKERDRNDNIFYKALKGATISELASEFNLSRARVEQIVGRSCRKISRECKESQNKDSIYNLYLSTRSYNALMRAGIRSIEDLGVALRDYGTVGLMMKLRNIGKQSMEEIISRYKQYTGNEVDCELDIMDSAVDSGFRLVIYDKIANNYKTSGINWGSLDDAHRYVSLARAKDALRKAQDRYLGSKDLVLRKCRTVLVED